MRSSCSADDRRAPIEAQIQNEAVRNLRLLHGIEETITHAVGVDQVLRGMATGVRAHTARLAKAERPAREIDPDGRLVESLEQVRTTCKQLRDGFLGTIVTASADPRVNPEDGVADACEDAAQAALELREAVNELILEVVTRDGIASGPAAEPFTNADKLIGFLRQ